MATRDFEDTLQKLQDIQAENKILIDQASTVLDDITKLDRKLDNSTTRIIKKSLAAIDKIDDRFGDMLNSIDRALSGMRDLDSSLGDHISDAVSFFDKTGKADSALLDRLDAISDKLSNKFRGRPEAATHTATTNNTTSNTNSTNNSRHTSKTLDDIADRLSAISKHLSHFTTQTPPNTANTQSSAQNRGKVTWKATKKAIKKAVKNNTALQEPQEPVDSRTAIEKKISRINNETELAKAYEKEDAIWQAKVESAKAERDRWTALNELAQVKAQNKKAKYNTNYIKAKAQKRTVTDNTTLQYTQLDTKILKELLSNDKRLKDIKQWAKEDRLATLENAARTSELDYIKKKAAMPDDKEQVRARQALEKDSATYKLLSEQQDQRFDLEKKEQELEAQKLKLADKEYIELEQQIKLRTLQLEKEQKLTKKQADALKTAGVTADSKDGKKIIRRVNRGQTREDLRAQNDWARSAVGSIPLIGKRLGETGDILELFDTMKANNDAAKASAAADGKSTKWASFWSTIQQSVTILASIARQLDGLVEEIARQRGSIDTRLNGLTTIQKKGGSYYNQITKDFSALLTSPLIKQKDLMANMVKVVEKGIGRDVEQMAMLETIKDKIATTFNTFDGTMLRLIKVQDYNTTAARLGMEASLNAMLNEMYQTTEYLGSLASQVRSSLGEAEALMTGQEGVAFEYQVQKWLGSLSSVGMSDSGVQAIASNLGKLAAGDLEGITNGGTGNLLVMAANNSNMSIADILANGLDASETNVLLNNVVGYLSELSDEANGSKVIQQQLAKIFGLTASDLRAVKNIVKSDFYTGASMKGIFETGAVSSSLQGYNNMLAALGTMANSMGQRLSMGEMMQNVMDNVKYSTAAGEATNPFLYITNKTADILESFAGGVPIPMVSVLGNTVDTKLKVSDIMKSAAMVGGLATSLVSMIGSIAGGNGAGWKGDSLLRMVGIDVTGAKEDKRSTSSSGTGSVVNASVDDMTNSATSSAEDSKKNTMVSAKEESTEVTNETINQSILDIKRILEAVIEGTSALHVKVDGQPLSISNDNSHWAWPSLSGM